MQGSDRTLAPDEPARALARRLACEARHGALATLDASDGQPLATRVGVAREPGGDVLLLLSDLADHTRALRGHSAASILLGATMPKGDPLAQPRLTLRGEVTRIEAGGLDHAAARARYLAHHPKASLYADFADFGFYRLRIGAALLNGGFARAYRLARGDLVREIAPDLLAREAGVIAHMNADHVDSLNAILRQRCGVQEDGWRIVTLDPLGFEAATGGEVRRVDFINPVETALGYRDAFVALARMAQGTA